MFDGFLNPNLLRTVHNNFIWFIFQNIDPIQIVEGRDSK